MMLATQVARGQVDAEEMEEEASEYSGESGVESEDGAGEESEMEEA